MALDETVRRLRALLSEADLTDDERADAEEVLDAADLLCRLERSAGAFRETLGAIEWARREQARERGGSDGK